ncbi:MAG: cyclophilin-like fold protein [Candidatus Omnitrophota bacterium]
MVDSTSNKVKLNFENVTIYISLNDSRTAHAILGCLPFESKASTWGDEIYFETPAKTKLQAGVTEVKKGDVGYWPTGRALCLFFGPTPMSKGEKIIPASAVDIIGKVEGNLSALKNISDGEEVKCEAV